jgi:hypothetical protein
LEAVITDDIKKVVQYRKQAGVLKVEWFRKPGGRKPNNEMFLFQGLGREPKKFH